VSLLKDKRPRGNPDDPEHPENGISISGEAWALVSLIDPSLAEIVVKCNLKVRDFIVSSFIELNRSSGRLQTTASGEDIAKKVSRQI